MGDLLTAQLIAAAEAGNAAAVQAALAAGADVGASKTGGITALLTASVHGHVACVCALLAAGADPNADDHRGQAALHWAADDGQAQCVAALLAAGADATAIDRTAERESPLMLAARCGSLPTVLALLAAAPQMAGVGNDDGDLPLDAALMAQHYSVARHLLQHGPLLPASRLLASLEAAHSRSRGLGQGLPLPTYQLYAPLVARQPLTPAEWAGLPSPCFGLGAALPAVLARSEAEAALLVAHLPADERQRLRTAALCIKRVERSCGVELPPALLRPLLLTAAAEPTPLVLIVMGAMGCGKSTVAALLADRLGCPFYEGDDFHPPANIDKMRAGVPLSDDDRWPWLEQLSGIVQRHLVAGQPAVLACSALKPAYRRLLATGRRDVDSSGSGCGSGGYGRVAFVLLDVPRELLHERLEQRQQRGGHFTPGAALLGSQLAALEYQPDELWMHVQARPPFYVALAPAEWIVGEALQRLQLERQPLLPVAGS